MGEFGNIQGTPETCPRESHQAAGAKGPVFGFGFAAPDGRMTDGSVACKLTSPGKRPVDSVGNRQALPPGVGLRLQAPTIQLMFL